MLCIWDKKENKTVPIDDYNLYIGADGKVYELEAAAMGGDVWLSREDASIRYEVRYWLDQLIK
ncbi:hypothetical protein ACFVQB_14685 [Paenibacillus sp. NPDC057886]|uniref:hypothetical protein n=1 Tax=Paenibacillus sp. NPDC057886 TaxID=3346270 RepID=UPI0036A0EFA6